MRNVSTKWTLESCLEDAKKHSRKSDWVRANKSAYYAAKIKGWFEECVAHMNQDKSEYTVSKLVEIASRFESRHAWKLQDKKSYDSAQRRGLLSDIANDVFGDPKVKAPRKTVWTAENILLEAMRYQSRTDWAKGCPRSYDAARRLRILEQCSKHMQVLTCDDYRSKIEAAAAKYNSKTEWRLGDEVTYKRAMKYGCVKSISLKLWGPKP